MLTWSDVVVDSSHTVSESDLPPGCLHLGMYLIYNTLTTSTTSCTSDDRCACSILCPSGTYQDEDGQTTCKLCQAGEYQDVEGESECKTCPPGTVVNDDRTTCLSSCSYTDKLANCSTAQLEDMAEYSLDNVNNLNYITFKLQ